MATLNLIDTVTGEILVQVGEFLDKTVWRDGTGTEQ